MRASAISHFFSGRYIRDTPRRLLSHPGLLSCAGCAFAIVAFHGFIKDGCSSRASLLTYYSLFAIVPVLAMAFGIARGFGLERLAEARTAQMAHGMNWPPEVIGQVISFSRTMLARTSGGLIAGIGFVALFWSVLSILRSIEQNAERHLAGPGVEDNGEEGDGLSRGGRLHADPYRHIGQRDHLPGERGGYNKPPVPPFWATSGRAYYVALGALPYLSICGMLILTCLVIPNTRVRVRSAVAAALFTAVIYQSVQFIYIKFQLGVASYGAIYGGFAAVGLFIVWLRLHLDDRPVRRGDRGG